MDFKERSRRRHERHKEHAIEQPPIEQIEDIKQTGNAPAEENTIFSDQCRALPEDFSPGYQTVWEETHSKFVQAWSDAFENSKSIFKAEQEVLRRDYKEWQQYGSYLRSSYASYFRPDKDVWPQKWWFKNTRKDKRGTVIEERYNDPKDKVFHRMVAIGNYLLRIRPRGASGMEESFSLEERLGIGMHTTDKGVKRHFGLIKPLISEIEKEVDCKRDTIYGILDEMVARGMLRKFKKAGPNEPVVYAVGYWVPMSHGRWRVIPFVQETEHFKDALVRFGQKVKSFFRFD
jgi:hypothetical protein